MGVERAALHIFPGLLLYLVLQETPPWCSLCEALAAHTPNLTLFFLRLFANRIYPELSQNEEKPNNIGREHRMRYIYIRGYDDGQVLDAKVIHSNQLILCLTSREKMFMSKLFAGASALFSIVAASQCGANHTPSHDPPSSGAGTGVGKFG